jgi:hypothetical protein
MVNAYSSMEHRAECRDGHDSSVLFSALAPSGVWFLLGPGMSILSSGKCGWGEKVGSGGAGTGSGVKNM